MAEIKKRRRKNGDFSYTASIRIKGCPIMTATFSRLTDAKEWISENELPLKRGKHIKNSNAQKHTAGELIDRYIEYELKNRKSDKDKYKMHLAWWKKQIGAYLLSSIDNIMLSEYRDKLSKEKCLIPRKNMSPKISDKTRSNSTVNRYMASLSTVLSLAVKEYGWLDENPMLKVIKKKEPRGRVKYLTDKEVEKLLSACLQQSNELYLCILIALSTGARYSEITNLSWKDVDMEHKQFHFLNTKNGDDRGVAITSNVYAELLKFQKIRNINSDLLFATKDGRKTLYIRGQFENALKTAKIKDFHFHDLRHTAASYLAKGGASLLEIATILGHKTLAMVQRYSHLTKGHTAEVLENMNIQMFKNVHIGREA
ncbi:MAG: site-specific integrase [Candidatus Gastranaerophilales bacterium]|nr:site-specific integrase [Candidatus Gastranaerophilales bacterium]